MADHNQLDLFPLRDIADHTGRDGLPRFNYNMAWGAVRRGSQGRDGTRVFLQSIRVGRSIVTCRLWVENYLRELAAADQRHFGDNGAAAKPIERKRLGVSNGD